MLKEIICYKDKAAGKFQIIAGIICFFCGAPITAGILIASGIINR